MKKRFVGLALACVMFAAMGLAACGDDEEKSGIGEAEWNETITEFITESGVEAELRLFAGHFGDFTLADGKYTANEIQSTDGLTCKNIVITVDGDKIVKVEYELRASSKDTPDHMVTIDKDGIVMTELTKPSDGTQPSGEKLDEDAWALCVDALAASKNYTQTSQNKNVFDLYKVDGETDYREVLGTYYSGKIYTKKNGSFFFYNKEAADSLWTVEEIDASEYNDSFKSNSLVGDAADILRRNYKEFTYDAEEGKYTLAQAAYSTTTNVENIEVTVSEGMIVRISFYVSYFGDVVIDQFGTTQISLPAVGAPGPVTGKTFVFFKMSGKGVTSEDLDQMNSRNSGLEIVFNADGTIKVTADQGHMIEEGTYTQNGGTISVTFTKITQDGEVIETQGQFTGEFTYDGRKLIQVLELPPQTYYAVYMEQAA